MSFFFWIMLSNSGKSLCLFVRKLVTETRQLIKTIPWLYFSAETCQLLVQNSANNSTEASLSLLCTTVHLESPVNHVWRVYCWAFGTSSTKIRDIECQPVYALALLWPVVHFPTQNPTRTFPLWMLLQWPSIWRWRWRLWFLPVCM